MSSEQPVHVFPFSDSTRRIYCGNWFTGDGWTVLPDQVSCPDCMKRAVAMALGASADFFERALSTDDGRSWQQWES